MRNRNSKRLVPLSQRGDLTIAAGDPDMRGWWVFSADGDRVGRVHDLIVDVDAMKVVFLDVLLSATARPNRVSDDHHVVAPVRDVHLHEPSKWVFVESLTTAGFAALPRYDRNSARQAEPPRTRRIEIGRGVRLVGGEHERGRRSSR